MERLSLLILFGSLAAPFLGAWFGRIAGKRAGHARIGTGLGLGLGVFAVPFGLWFAMCTPPVGRGATAERWYREAAPLIVALEQYHQRRGVYPDSLSTLVPVFLNPEALSAIHLESNGTLKYQRDTAGYTLRFEYHGPGMNHCTYQPSAHDWRCGGYF